MLGQLNDDLRGHVISGGLRKVVDDDRQRGAVSDCAIESQHIGRLHLSLVVMRRTHHCNVVSQLGCVLGEAQGLNRRLDSGSGNQHLVVGRRFAGRLQHLPLLFPRKENGFSSRAEHDDARHRGTRIAFDVGFELLVVNVTVGIERRGDGGKDSGKKHQSIS